jgi:hypothetical protein
VSSLDINMLRNLPRKFQHFVRCRLAALLGA